MGVLLLPGVAPAGDTSVTDDFGSRVSLAVPAQRIIALYGAFNEILAAMGLEERIVGRTKADSLPPSIISKPSIGTHMRPNIEVILALKPDLIIQSAGRKEGAAMVDQLRKAGLSVAVFSPNSFDGLFSVIRRLGVLTGEKPAGENLVGSIEKRLAEVETRIRGVESRPSVFFEVRHTNLLAAGRGSIVNEIIERAGGQNCIDLPKKMVRIGMETLIEKNPQIYLVQKGPMNQNPSLPSERSQFEVLDAVKKGRFLVVDEQVYSRPGPRSVEAVEELARFLHPER
ncbi:MAG: ABC transporter substrate-binding protein [Desulfobacteraceae bacterium]|nr:MAG: ABC transporter substrate-binding protein [Desulfobacteraceae bacterium]